MVVPLKPLIIEVKISVIYKVRNLFFTDVIDMILLWKSWGRILGLSCLLKISNNEFHLNLKSSFFDDVFLLVLF